VPPQFSEWTDAVQRHLDACSVSIADQYERPVSPVLMPVVGQGGD
jgi:hypothetical protein